jgi:uncharacterized MAPEG superfamily protein
MSLPTNFSVLAIPGYYLLSFLPHAYALHVATSGQPLKWDNRNPRAVGLKSRLQTKLPPELYALYERGEAASANCYENMPIFYSAIVMGHIAGLDKTFLNNFAFKYLMLRAAYIFSYVGITNQKYTPIRTILYFWSIVLCSRVLITSAKKLA